MSVTDGMALLQNPKGHIVILIRDCYQPYLMSSPNTETSNTTGSASLYGQVTGLSVPQPGPATEPFLSLT